MPLIDPNQTGQDLNTAILAGESALQKDPFHVIPAPQQQAMERLLATFQALANDPVRWPALVSFLNNLGQTP